ncbi:MAG: FAD-binding oxidoreductase [Acidobacteriia bacterium]|nr:FAD-binding oxidoreductase [Terriglobia bacterium]
MEADYRRKTEALAAEVSNARARGERIGLRKSTSNLFRHRSQAGKHFIDVRSFHRVLAIDPQRMTADVEGMITYEALVEETLKYGLLPAIVPQLKTITVGGAVSGLGIESSSFKFGLVHETIEKMEIMLGDGRLVTCSCRENPDLFFGFPNSYGTLGYALRLTIRLIPAKPYVHLTHTRFADPESYFARVAERAESPVDYLDGTIFSRGEMYLTEGQFVDHAPSVSDYTYMDIYYRSIQQKSEDWLTAKDYIWRWDTDWFWCSKHFYVQQPGIRRLFKWALNSRTYQRIMRLSYSLMPDSGRTESVIQDVDIPIDKAPEFFDFLLSEIGITPVWVCPFRTRDSARAWDLSPLRPGQLYVNFGFWDVIPTTHEKGHFNRMIERKTMEVGGAKGLYSSAWYDEAEFWSIYDQPRYVELKQTYDPQAVFPDLYSKCVRRH